MTVKEKQLKVSMDILEGQEQLTYDAIDAILDLCPAGYEEKLRPALAIVRSIQSDIRIKMDELESD